MKYLFILTLLSFANLVFSQDPTAAKKLVEEGIVAHDHGDYDEAINKYDQALAIDHGNMPALSEKAMTLLTQKKAEAAIEVCKIAIKINPKDPALGSLSPINFRTQWKERRGKPEINSRHF